MLSKDHCLPTTQKLILGRLLVTNFASVMTVLKMSPVLMLPAAKQRICNYRTQTLPFSVLSVYFWTFWWKPRDSIHQGCKMV